MTSQLQLGDLTVDVRRKAIRNVHLSVHPPTGKVTLSVPEAMNADAIRLFAISKLDWIKKQQRAMRAQERETPREYLERESHYVSGMRYLVTVEEIDHSPGVALQRQRLILRVRPGTTLEKREAVLERWLRERLKEAVPALIEKWEPKLGVSVERFSVRRMKTRWGSCNPMRRSILVNTDLAKKPPPCLEYIVVHEMVHLLEPTHNERFVHLMDTFLPQWPTLRKVLNDLPVRHQKWTY